MVSYLCRRLRREEREPEAMTTARNAYKAYTALQNGAKFYVVETVAGTVHICSDRTAAKGTQYELRTFHKTESVILTEAQAKKRGIL
jgi:predicted DNA-binding WGR domain protein